MSTSLERIKISYGLETSATMKEMIDEALNVLMWDNPQDTLIEKIKEQNAMYYHVRFIICIKRSGGTQSH